MPQESRRPVLLLGLCAAAAAVALPHPAAGQTYTYNGPFTGTGGTANPWSTDNWIGGTPVSGATTQLVFPSFDSVVYSANNDLGNPFVLNSVTSQSWSRIAHTINSAAGNSFQLSGVNPAVTIAGPGSMSFSTFGGALSLNPTSGTTTFGGAGNGTLSTGTTGISGAGGIAVNFTGAGGVTLLGTNTYTGGVTLNTGSLGIGNAAALGDAANVLTINGGTVRTTGTFTVPNSLVLNRDLVFTNGTLLGLNGTVSGAGGVTVVNGTNFNAQNLTFNNALSFAGPLTIQNSLARPSGSSSNLATVTLTNAASFGGAGTITVGNNGTLSLTGNNPHILNANNLVFNGGRLSVTGTSGGNLAETFGNVTASGLNTFTFNPGATSSTLNFGNLSRQDNATLFFRGSAFGTTNVARFANGLTTVSDPLAPNATGQYTAIVPFATTNANATFVNAANRVTYDPVAGVGSFSPVNASFVYQATGGETLVAANDYKNVNLTGDAVVNDARRVNSLSMTAVGTISGSGTLTVSSGAVMPVHGSSSAVVFNGPTLDFGAATGYVHLGGNLTVQGASTITGSGGLVVSGLDAPGSSTTNGANGGYTVQFSNAANAFTGGLYVNGNAGVNFTGDAQLGAAGGRVTLNGGGLNFNPTGSNGSVVINRPITLGAAGGSFSGITGNSIALAGVISGGGDLTIGSSAFANGGATVTLSGTNTYTGATYVEGISTTTLRVASDANLGGTASPVNIQGTGATLQFTAPNTFAKPITFSGSGGSNLDTNGNAVTLTAPLSGTATGGFNKVGVGTLTLATASPLFSGLVNVNAGTLNLAAANTLPQVTTLTVNSGGVLAGNGLVGGSVIVAAGGTLSPGNSAGRITVGNNLTFAANSVAFMELGGATSADYDQLVVGGALTLNGTLTLSLANNFVPTLNEKFYLFDDLGLLSPTGTFANSTGTGNLLFTDNAGNTYQINYADHDPADLSNALNNDVSLTVVGVVPEPSTWALLLASVAGTGLFARARRSSARGVARRHR